MPRDTHYGPVASGPLVQDADPRVGQLDTALRAAEAVLQTVTPGLSLDADAFRVRQNQALARTDLAGHVLPGTVVHPIAGLNWYKVQCGRVGFVPCFTIAGPAAAPLGVREVGGVAPGARVLVWKPQGLKYGVILGVLPPLAHAGAPANPDWVVQGGRSGHRREEFHRYPARNHYQGGSIQDFSGQRPVDSTSLEAGLMSATGLGFTVDDFLAQFRANEMCGLFTSYFDSHARLAGAQLDVESLVHALQARDDEGESRYFVGVAGYPWEALGLYRSGEDFTESFDERRVQYEGHEAAVDLPTGAKDVQPFYRYREYGGYLGQGHLRMVVAPPRDSGVRRYGQPEPDEGLFCESVGADGFYSLRSAKGVYIGKRCLIVAPFEVRPPEHGRGDDARADNYRFSSQFGGAEEHRVSDVRVEGDFKSVRKAAGAMDLIAHAVNWKALHPFHYHKADYRTWQEAEASAAFSRVQEHLDYSALASQPAMPDPEPKTLRIDHRYNRVEYFERESFLFMLDDGGIVLSAGCGESLVLSGGRVRVDAPAGIDLCSGRDAVLTGAQVVVKGRDSVDVHAANHDLRLSAFRNMQMVAGYSGEGGMLLESKSTGRAQRYENRVGEDVRASGIVLKATNGFAGIYGREVYLRSGADGTAGNVVVDASRGAGDVLFKARECNSFVQRECNVYVGPSTEAEAVNRVYHFGRTSCVMDARLFLGGRLVSYSGSGGGSGIVVDGNIYATKSIAAAGVVADRKGMFLGKVPDGFSGTLQTVVQAAGESVDSLRRSGEDRLDATITQQYYQADQPGEDAGIGLIGFSFRDDDGEVQYRTKNFHWVESRWQQMVRLGLASGGEPWAENPITYQGRRLYPWPGRRKWGEEAVFLRLGGLTMFDPAAGRDRDRPYEDPALADLSPTTMAAGFKLTV